MSIEFYVEYLKHSIDTVKKELEDLTSKTTEHNFAGKLSLERHLEQWTKERVYLLEELLVRATTDEELLSVAKDLQGALEEYEVGKAKRESYVALLEGKERV